MAGISTFRNIQPSTLVNKLISCIETHLSVFTKSNEFLEILASKKNENQHSKAFCVYMTNVCWPSFQFQGENSQKSNYAVDIGVYNGAILIFTIEAKVLPIPLYGDRKEYEYVYGKGGGIQRFKYENHGLDNQGRLLPDNGIIGYVNEQDFEYWHSTINQWVIKAPWPKDEKLEKVSFNKIARLKSTHPRIGGSKVTLHHFWVNVN